MVLAAHRAMAVHHQRDRPVEFVADAAAEAASLIHRVSWRGAGEGCNMLSTRARCPRLPPAVPAVRALCQTPVNGAPVVCTDRVLQPGGNRPRTQSQETRMKTRAALAHAAGKPLEVATVDLEGP